MIEYETGHLTALLRLNFFSYFLYIFVIVSSIGYLYRWKYISYISLHTEDDSLNRNMSNFEKSYITNR